MESEGLEGRNRPEKALPDRCIRQTYEVDSDSGSYVNFHGHGDRFYSDAFGTQDIDKHSYKFMVKRSKDD